jgi:hypothetical protein
VKPSAGVAAMSSAAASTIRGEALGAASRRRGLSICVCK